MIDRLHLRAFGGAVKAAAESRGVTEDPSRPLLYEKMDAAKWKQTAKDLPVVIAAQGVGWGIGKTLADKYEQRALRSGGPAPKWVRHAPAIAGALNSVGAYALGRSRAELKERREAASAAAKKAKVAGVSPAPQSRGLPKKKPSDPWRYDPRPAAML